MQCDDFHVRVNVLLDHRRDPSEDSSVLAHAESCNACHRDLKNYQRVVAAMAIPQKNPKRTVTSSYAGRLVLGAAVAATFLLALFLLPNENASKENVNGVPSIGSVAKTIATDAKQPDSNMQSGIRPNAFVQQKPMVPLEAAMAKSRNNSYVQPTLLSIRLFASTNWTHLAPKEIPFGVTVPSMQTQWIQVVADEISPVRESVNNTVELIFRTFSKTGVRQAVAQLNS